MTRSRSLAVALLLAALACEREKRELEPIPAKVARPAFAPFGSAQPSQDGEPPPGGGAPKEPILAADPALRAYDLAEGKRLWRWFNCYGCHGAGGGGIGPALMDGTWIYGSDPTDIYTSIVAGRPNGMPSYRGRIPDQQVWNLVGYVRSLSGNAPKDAAPGRSDDMAVRPPENLTPAEKPGAPAVQQGGRR